MHIKYGPGNLIKTIPSPIDQEVLSDLLRNFVLIYTGIQRFADEVLVEQTNRMKEGSIDFYLTSVAKLVPIGIEALRKKNYSLFGRLLDEAWSLKKNFSSAITNPIIDDLYSLVKSHGALGGKLLGAGGGGFFLVYIEPQYREPLLKSLNQFSMVDFNYDAAGSCSYII